MRLSRAPLLAAAVLTLNAAVPTPESHFGHKIGVDRVLFDWNKVVTYFQALEKSSARIRVSGRDAGEFHEFAVADDGPGIPLHLQPRIWTLFQTLPREGVGEGTGIGLAVVRKLVELRGGRIDVTSSEGAGATFHFTWPKCP